MPVRKILAAGAPVNGNDALGATPRIVFQRVIPYVFGNGNSALAARHDRTVSTDGIVAVHTGQKRRANTRVDTLQGPPANPGRQTRVHVYDIRLFFPEPFG